MAQSNPATACPTFEEDLVLFHYGDLAGAARQVVENHVTACRGCAAYLAELATLLPLTAKADEPPQDFWMNYNRELRHKMADTEERSVWWPKLSTLLRPRLIAAFGAAAVIVLALTLTLGRNPSTTPDNGHDDEIAETLPVAENLDFFSAMDVLDDLDLLELMGSQNSDAA